MKQAVLVDHQTLQIKDGSVPEPIGNQVLVEVEVCGICGSDMHIYKGDHPVIQPPVVMGHEFSGRVAKVGANVTQFSVHDYVAAIPGVGCGSCPYCENGQFNLCSGLKVIGGHFPGGFSQYVLVPEDYLITVPEHFSALEGAMIESVAVAVHAVERMGDVAGKSFAVLGAGPIGLLTIQVLKAFGASSVVVSDPVEHRRNLALRLGADLAIDSVKEPIEEKVKGFVGLYGLDGAFDCAGLEITLTQALSITKQGANIVLVAIYGKNPVIPMRLLQRGERKLIGTQMYIKENFETAKRLMENEKVVVKPLVSHQFALDEIGEAFQTIAANQGNVGKVLIKIK